jgi:hypothetical protein
MTRITDADGSARIDDGKLTIIDDGDAAVFLETPDQQPLGAGQLHATVRIAGEDFQAVADLDADGLDALADAVTTARDEFGTEGDR